MKCQYCDNEIPVESATCPSCGAPAPKPQDSQPQASPPPTIAAQVTPRSSCGQQQAVSFMEAVKRFWTTWSYKGRASRSEFWFAFLAYCICGGVLGAIADEMGALFNIAAFWPFICVSARRLHDVGKSGWWQIVPIANLIFWVQPSDAADNPYGPVPNVK